jgi:tRNA-splicing ligase RtcB
MQKVINTERVPIKLWLDDIENGALEQAKNLANLPFAYKWVAIMPDSHEGYGMPIGGVLATQEVIIPNAVGVDIGCGMCVVKSNIKNATQDDIKKIFGGSKENHGGIRAKIPVGFNWHKKSQDVNIEADHTDMITPI